LPTTNVLTLPPETNKDNHPTVAPNSSSPSPPPAYPHVLTLSAVEQPVSNPPTDQTEAHDPGLLPFAETRGWISAHICRKSRGLPV
jgi:hypothetical protein